MNKRELIKSVAENGHVSIKEAHAALDMVVEAIMAEVSAGNDITLAGFGSFKVIDVDAHNARNPKTGETVSVPAYKKPTFKFSKSFKDSMK